MKIKKMSALLLVVVMVINLCATVYAADPLPEFAITDDVVVIEYVPYEISDGTIQYNGKTYEVKDSFLVTYDEEGPIYLILPVEQNRVTNPAKIKELNASANAQAQFAQSIYPSLTSLPYSAKVPAGTRTLTTPNFSIVESGFAYVTCLKLSGFALFADRRFDVTFNYNNAIGEWTTVNVGEVDFLTRNPLRFQNFSNVEYGHFILKSICPNTPPAYTYEVYKSNAT